MSVNTFLSIIKKYAISNSEPNDIHGFPHVQRVYNTCMQIGTELNANLSILKISALLHDVGRVEEKKTPQNRNHAEISAEKAVKFLKNNSFKLSIEEIENISHCIRAHSFSNKVAAKTLEAKILSDADKIDALGAIGIYRTIGFTIKDGGGIEQVINHLEDKIIKLMDLFYLDLSKQIATTRYDLVMTYYNKLIKEISNILP